MDFSIAMLSQLCVLAATGGAAIYTVFDLCSGARGKSARPGGHGRARRA